VRALVLVLLIGCVHPVPGAPGDAPDEITRDRQTEFTIWLGGARVGTAIETERWRAGQLVLRRDESMRFFRGSQAVALSTTIEIHASTGLVASRVSWQERSGPIGGSMIERRSQAERDATGWHTSTGGWLPADATPAELVPLLTRRDGAFAGRVFLPARNYLVGSGRIDPVTRGRLVARLVLDGGAVVEATIDVDARGNYTRIVDGEGVIALRTTTRRAAEPFQPVDLIAATSIPIAGAPSHTLILDAGIAIPPVPGQLARPDVDGIALELSPQLPGSLPYGVFGRDRTSEIAALVEAVRARIAPDLGARSGTPDDATSAVAGDCTTFALAYAALASKRQIPTRVVTGFRVSDGRLVRHRWAISWTGKAWIAVDAAFGAVPAGGDLIGLAMHGADDAGLVAGEAALAQVRSATWR